MRALRQADRILTVRIASDSPELSAAEFVIFDERKDARMPPVELVLLHENTEPVFPGTARWLAQRDVVRHHHVRLRVPEDTSRLARRAARSGSL
jgi:hypothetical protein